MLAVLLEQKQRGETFARWPLHITLVSWFQLQKPLPQLVDAVQQAAMTHQVFHVVVGPAKQWRHHQVHLIESKTLESLHQSLLGIVKRHAQFMNQPMAVGPDFTPHITQKPYAKVQSGFRLPVKQIYIIEAPIINPINRFKKVVGVAELN
ncbi:2'-5' RNA ligase family protein [Candidatus Saccharibacteria bacterium]|nr:2'-5' RNA ligase family protein [Candidatus Saccharibacteria bacterium]